MDNNNFYAPSGNVKGTSRTYVPDLYRQVAAEMRSEEEVSTPEFQNGQVLRLQQRQLVGVLYSLSAGPDGELFPVYVGRNRIGSDTACDICLRESSVSEYHALLLTRKQTDYDGREYVNVVLSDNNSPSGTSVNGECLYDRQQCSDGDIIGVGQHYELVLSLFTAFDKLSVSRGFDRLPDPKPEPQAATTPEAQVASPVTARQPEADVPVPEPNSDTYDDDADFYRPSNKTSQDHYNNKTIIL